MPAWKSEDAFLPLIIKVKGLSTRITSNAMSWKIKKKKSFKVNHWCCISKFELTCSLICRLTWEKLGSAMATVSPMITPLPGAKLYRLTARHLECLSVKQNVLKIRKSNQSWMHWCVNWRWLKTWQLRRFDKKRLSCLNWFRK